MNLIISLLGQKHHNLFTKKSSVAISDTNSFLLSVSNNIRFCKKIFIICNKKKNIN